MVIDEHGCWLWQGGRNPDGYGIYRRTGSNQQLAHRWSYLTFVGPIPSESLDHLCRVRHCINPAHLEPCTLAENSMRGNGPPAINARKTHCAKGHEYTPENTAYRTGKANGHRICRICQRASSATQRRKHGVPSEP